MSEKKNQAQGDDNPDILIGYMSITELSKDLFRGGLLMVDLKGRPQDFRCTSVIKPNAIQRALYGGTLAGHMALNLCGLPLLEALGKQPTLLVAGSPDLLALRVEIEIPMLWIRRQGAVLPSSQSSGGACELVASDAGLFDTLLASCAAGHGEELEAGIKWIRQIGSLIDPLEPFTRIESALKLVQNKAGSR
jgi:hypothetical protein